MLQGTVAIVVDARRGLGSEKILVELVPMDGEYAARVCRYRTADGQLTRCDAEFHRGADCAVEADVTLSHLPTGAADSEVPAVRVRARLADGTAIEVSL